MFKKSPLKATKLHRHRRKIRILKLSFGIALVLCIIGITMWLSRLSLFAINDVVVDGAIGINALDIKIVAEKHLAGAYVSIYSKSNKIIYPKKAITSEIKANFPGIETLNVKTENHSLKILLSERKPSYIWCAGTIDTIMADACYFLDNSGFIFSKGPTISGNAYLTFFGLITTSNPIGETFLGTEKILAIEELKKTLDADRITLKAIVAVDEDVFELHLASGGKIIFKAEDLPRRAASSIELLKKKTELLNHSAKRKLEYIDLRFGNKVYYKFVGDNAVQTRE